MSRIAATFAALAERGRKALIPYVTAGDPHADTTPQIMQAMVAGDRRPYLVGLIVPDAEWAAEWAVANGEKFDLVALSDLPAFRNALRAAVDRVNKELSVIEKVRQIALADEPFGIENEEMTPSMKIRRHKIRERYGARLDGLYRAG